MNGLTINILEPTNRLPWEWARPIMPKPQNSGVRCNWTRELWIASYFPGWSWMLQKPHEHSYPWTNLPSHSISHTSFLKVLLDHIKMVTEHFKRLHFTSRDTLAWWLKLPPVPLGYMTLYYSWVTIEPICNTGASQMDNLLFQTIWKSRQCVDCHNKLHQYWSSSFLANFFQSPPAYLDRICYHF